MYIIAIKTNIGTKQYIITNKYFNRASLIFPKNVNFPDLIYKGINGRTIHPFIRLT